MTEISARIADLINFSSNQKPIEFGLTFKEILQDKVAAAIEAKKTEIAGRMFSPPEDEVEDEDQEDLEQETEVETEEQEDGEAA